MDLVRDRPTTFSISIDQVSEEQLSDSDSWLNHARNKVVSIFLPKGYPQSTTDNYLRFTQWNLLGAVCGTTIGGTLTG